MCNDIAGFSPSHAYGGGGGGDGRSRETLNRIYPLGSVGQSSSIVLMADGAKLVPPVFACRG